jgi:hypothetical protein
MKVLGLSQYKSDGEKRLENRGSHYVSRFLTETESMGLFSMSVFFE